MVGFFAPRPEYVVLYIVGAGGKKPVNRARWVLNGEESGRPAPLPAARCGWNPSLLIMTSFITDLQWLYEPGCRF